ncbi:MAG: hypothetical protein AVDCRST_MAG27-3539, partial [uncultured Craurococcus sp.]
ARRTSQFRNRRAVAERPGTAAIRQLGRVRRRRCRTSLQRASTPGSGWL